MMSWESIDGDLDDLVLEGHGEDLNNEQILQQWIQQTDFDLFITDESLPISAPKQTRTRPKARFSVDYTQTNWGKFLVDPEVKDPDSRKGKLFRRRFRVPYTVFCWICTKCKERNVFEIKREASVEIPIAIKVLLCLRILGRGDCCDSISEFK